MIPILHSPGWKIKNYKHIEKYKNLSQNWTETIMLIALTGNHLPKDTSWEDDNRVTKEGKKIKSYMYVTGQNLNWGYN